MAGISAQESRNRRGQRRFLNGSAKRVHSTSEPHNKISFTLTTGCSGQDKDASSSEPQQITQATSGPSCQFDTHHFYEVRYGSPSKWYPAAILQSRLSSQRSQLELVWMSDVAIWTNRYQQTDPANPSLAMSLSRIRRTDQPVEWTPRQLGGLGPSDLDPPEILSPLQNFDAIPDDCARHG